MFFVPVASLLEGTAMTETSILTRALIKVFWLLIIVSRAPRASLDLKQHWDGWLTPDLCQCAALALVNKAASIALSLCRRSFGHVVHVKEELILVESGRLPKAA